MLHGRGADEHDLFGLKDHFDHRLTIVSLRAPWEYDWGGYTWFDMYDDGSVDPDSFHKSKKEILEFLATLNTKQLFLMGFSMGAIMSYAIALTQPGICSGIIALSGFAPHQLEQEYRLDKLQNLHIFISHGINDPVIPVAAARKTEEMLRQSNAHVSYHEYRMGHQISDQCLQDVKNWTNQLL